MDWNRVARVQSEDLRIRLERGAPLARRHLEVDQAVVTAAAAWQQAREVA
jgi:hypothetical protein